MTKKKTILLMQLGLNPLKIFILISLISLFLACNNNGETKQKSQKEMADTSGENGPGTLAIGDFSVLQLKKDSLVKLFSHPNTSKILLQFVDDKTSTSDNPIRLIAYGATNRNVVTSGPVQLDPVPGQNPINISGEKYLGNLEISKKKLASILGIQGNPPINAGNAKDLFFEPTTHVNYAKYVLYYVGLSYPMMKTQPTPPPPTNPSPPAPPCETDCEQ